MDARICSQLSPCINIPLTLALDEAIWVDLVYNMEQSSVYIPIRLNIFEQTITTAKHVGIVQVVQLLCSPSVYIH